MTAAGVLVVEAVRVFAMVVHICSRVTSQVRRYNIELFEASLSDRYQC